MEWRALLGVADRLPQGVYVLDKQVASAVVQVDREEEGSAGDAVAPIVGHFGDGKSSANCFVGQGILGLVS